MHKWQPYPQTYERVLRSCELLIPPCNKRSSLTQMNPAILPDGEGKKSLFRGFASSPLHLLHLSTSPPHLLFSSLSYQLHHPHPRFTHRLRSTHTIMGLGFLRALRICLVLFTSIFFILFATTMGRYLDYEVSSWYTWVTLFLAIYVGIAYGWALKAQAAKRNIIKSNCARGTGSLLLCAAWLFFHYGVLFHSGCEQPECSLEFAMDLFGFFVAILIFLELIFAYRYERSFKALKRDTEATSNIIVCPAPVPSAPLYAHQYVYDPTQQPGQPLMYYPQPVMTGPYQTPTMSYQAPMASYKIPQETPVHQPHPPPTH